MPHSSPYEQFVAAIASGEDKVTESRCTQLGPADEQRLLTLTRADDGDTRWWSARGLAHCGTQTALAPLTDLLADADAGVRAAAALALAYIHRRLQDVDAAATVQAGEPSANRFSFPPTPPSHLQQMAALLEDPDGLVRQTASAALALCGDDAVPVLQSILEDSQQSARTRAARALGKIATIPAAIVLYHYLDDSNHLVRTHAYETLDALGLLENQLVVV